MSHVRHSQQGAGLVEAMIAMVVTSVVILGLAGLVLCGVRLQQASRTATTATAIALAEIERIRILPPAHPQQQLGGTLEGPPDDDHFAVPQEGFTARWLIANGPVGTRDLTMRVADDDGSIQAADVTVRLYP